MSTGVNVTVDSICKSLCKISRLNLEINLTLQQWVSSYSNRGKTNIGQTVSTSCPWPNWSRSDAINGDVIMGQTAR